MGGLQEYSTEYPEYTIRRAVECCLESNSKIEALLC
jgi:hypothetical protein